MKGFERGSEWRRWDLHIHTPETQKNDQYEGQSVEEKWELFYKTISEYIGDGNDPQKAVVVVGITDYLSIDNYLKVIQDKKLPDTIKLVLPNVELRMTPFAKSSPVNIHCIFDPILANQLETRFFAKLEFSYNERKYGASHSELIQLGRTYYGDNFLNDDVAYKCGLEQYIITPQTLKKVFDNDLELREHTIIAVSNSSGDGVSGIVTHSSYFTNNISQMDATRRTIYQMADVIFSAKESDRKYFLGMGADDVKIVKKKCGSLMGCIHGSDAHTNNRVFEPIEKRYCWIKADPTFNGLRQILYEPEARICISSIKPETKPDYHVIERVEIDDSNFSKEPILFNDKLTCIIGGKSTGKSLLLHNMAKTIDPTQVEKKSEVTKNGNKSITNLKVFWADGSINSTEVTNSTHKIVYIPQTYLNRLSDEHEEITEIDQIIHDIIMINSTVKVAYENMESKLKNHKLRIDKMLYELIQYFDMVKIKKEELAEIGTRSGIEKELKKLKKQKEQLSKELLLTEEEIKSYDVALSTVGKIEIQIAKIEEEQKEIMTVSSVVKRLPLEYMFTQEIQNEMENIIIQVIEVADEFWKKSKDNILEMLKGKLEKLLKEKETQLEVVNVLAPKISENEAVNKLTKAIQIEEKKLNSFEEIEKQLKECEKLYNELVTKISKAFIEYYLIHSDYAFVVNENSDLNSDDLEFSAETPFRVEAFLKHIEAVFNKNTLKKQKHIIDIEHFSNEWSKIENVELLIKACVDGTLRLNGGKTPENALREILGDWYNSTYRVKMDDDLIDDMSPGKKALVLLKMLINMADSKCPILIDQPEDDLDNRSVFAELIPFVKKKKIDRQIIIVTHNANVVLGGDAEEVIVANQNGKNSPNKEFRFEYRTGAIEDNKPLKEDRQDVLGKQGIQQHICEILEGGESAFDLRKHKYHI